MKKINFYPVSTISVPFYSRFLSSKNQQIMRLAIDNLRLKEKITPMFHVSGFLKLLVPHIKSLDQQLLVIKPQEQIGTKPKSSSFISQTSTASITSPTAPPELLEENMSLSLNLMCEFMLKDDHCLIDVAGDAQIHDILGRRSHFIYSILLSREEALALANVDEEIEWWMKEGNEKYIEIYDKAVECAFEQQYNPSQTPEITSSLLQPPPHLFAQLAKAPTGQQKLSVYIPQLIEQCKNSGKKTMKAAFYALAHFASSAPEIYVKTYDIANVLIQSAFASSSLQIRGTLVSCLSLFQQSDYLSQTLQKNNWKVFRFGNRSCVIPVDPTILCDPVSETNQNIQHKPKEITSTVESKAKLEEMKKNPYYSLMVQLADPITMKQGKAELIQAYREHQSAILTPNTSLLASQLIADYSFSQDSRSFILGLFRSTPQMPLVTPKVDEEKHAECKVKIFEALQGGAPKGLDQVNWLKYAPGELTRHKFCKECPELYIRDDMLESTIGMSKSNFYKLTEEKRKTIREQILSSKQRNNLF